MFAPSEKLPKIFAGVLKEIPYLFPQIPSVILFLFMGLRDLKSPVRLFISFIFKLFRIFLVSICYLSSDLSSTDLRVELKKLDS